MHLTNYSINKHNENFDRDDSDDSGSKRYNTTTLLNNKHILCILITAINTLEMHELSSNDIQAASPSFLFVTVNRNPGVSQIVPFYGMRNLSLFPTPTCLSFSLNI